MVVIIMSTVCLYLQCAIRQGRLSIPGCRARPGYRGQLQPRDAQHIMLVACQGLPAYKRLHVLRHDRNVSLSHVAEGVICLVHYPKKFTLPEHAIQCIVSPAAGHQRALAPPWAEACHSMVCVRCPGYSGGISQGDRAAHPDADDIVPAAAEQEAA